MSLPDPRLHPRACAKALTCDEIAFLKTLPTDGTHRSVTSGTLESSIAHEMHLVGLCFVSSGDWPNIIARITYETRKVLMYCE